MPASLMPEQAEIMTPTANNIIIEQTALAGLSTDILVAPFFNKITPRGTGLMTYVKTDPDRQVKPYSLSFP